MAAKGAALCRPATDAELANPLATVDGLGWLGKSISGWQVLCLAAGGGRQGPLYAAAGGHVTVVDLSPEMLALDRQVAEERNMNLRLIEASMESMPMLRDNEFDLVIHPVSTCYVPDCRPVFTEVARVLRPGGLYISQHKSPTSLQSSLSRNQSTGYYQLEREAYSRTPVPSLGKTSSTNAGQRLREAGAQEYVHRLEQLLGGMAKAGLSIEDLTEPMHAKPDSSIDSFGDRAKFIPPYIRVKARRRGGGETEAKRSSLIITT
ncbi:MAG: class I SAM-dependent methyltransferase [Planctomycetota bacterium]